VIDAREAPPIRPAAPATACSIRSPDRGWCLPSPTLTTSPRTWTRTTCARGASGATTPMICPCAAPGSRPAPRPEKRWPICSKTSGTERKRNGKVENKSENTSGRDREKGANPLKLLGGGYRNRTGLLGFAIRCIACLPTRRAVNADRGLTGWRQPEIRWAMDQAHRSFGTLRPRRPDPGPRRPWRRDARGNGGRAVPRRVPQTGRLPRGSWPCGTLGIVRRPGEPAAEVRRAIGMRVGAGDETTPWGGVRCRMPVGRLAFGRGQRAAGFPTPPGAASILAPSRRQPHARQRQTRDPHRR